MGKLATAHRVLATEGLRGILRAWSEQPAVSRSASFVRYWTTQHDHRWIGRLASFVTETVFVEGLRILAPRALVDDALRCRLLLGRYERPERELLARHLDPAVPVIELGGGLGVVACLINRRLQDPTRHVVLEANPAMLPVLDENRRRNGARFTIIASAIGYGGSAALEWGTDCLSTMARGAEGEVTVPALTLRDVLARFPSDRCMLVCDIEGAEIELVANEAPLLAATVSLLVVEEHPEYVPAQDRAIMFDRLRQAGFRSVEQIADSHVFRNVAFEAN